MLLAVLVVLLWHGAAGGCLSYGIPPEDRNLITIKGEAMPLGFWGSGWHSAMLSTHVGKILAEEVLGIASEVSGVGARSLAALHALAGCRSPDADTPDAECPGSVPTGLRHHVALELWNQESMESKMQEAWAGAAKIIPETVGTMGYHGVEGQYLPAERLQQAYSHSGMPLQFYQAFDADWNTPAQYFDPIDAFNSSDLMHCGETVKKTLHGMQAYLRVTGDTDGVVEDALWGAVPRCWLDHWWISPACRNATETCVPFITAEHWYTDEVMQSATAHNMPIALAVAKTFDVWKATTRRHKPLTYWWWPDESFLDLGLKQLILPPYNETEHASQILTTAGPYKPLTKVMARGMEIADQRVHSFFRQMKFGPLAIDGMVRAHTDASGSTYEEVACEWVRQSEEVWSSWLSLCTAGQGLVKGLGKGGKGQVNFTGALLTQIGCEVCPAGRFSEELAFGSRKAFVCKECRAGTSTAAGQMGNWSCEPCPAGTYSDRPGSVCEQCPRGSYADGSSNTECALCPAKQQTIGAGSTSVGDCEFDEMQRIINKAPELTMCTVGLAAMFLLVPMLLGRQHMKIQDIHATKDGILIQTKRPHLILGHAWMPLRLKFDDTMIRGLDGCLDGLEGFDLIDDQTLQLARVIPPHEEMHRQHVIVRSPNVAFCVACGLQCDAAKGSDRRSCPGVCEVQGSRGTLRVAFPGCLLCVGFLGFIPAIIPCLAGPCSVVVLVKYSGSDPYKCLVSFLASLVIWAALYHSIFMGKTHLEKLLASYRKSLNLSTSPRKWPCSALRLCLGQNIAVLPGPGAMSGSAGRVVVDVQPAQACQPAAGWTGREKPWQRRLKLPIRCDPGPGRAIELRELTRFYRHFRGFLGQGRTMSYVVSNIVKPLTQPEQVSFAELVGPGRVDWYVSHFWGNPFEDFVKSLKMHSEALQDVDGEMRYWICSLSNRQWKDLSAELGDGNPEESSFYKAMTSATCRGTVMTLDRQAMPLTRSWCLFEVVLTLKRKLDSGNEDLVEAEGSETFVLATQTGILNQGNAHSELALALGKKVKELQMEDASASRDEDKMMIDGFVKAKIEGGFERVNEFVKSVMWNAMNAAKGKTLQAFDQHLDGLQKQISSSRLSRVSTVSAAAAKLRHIAQSSSARNSVSSGGPISSVSEKEDVVDAALVPGRICP